MRIKLTVLVSVLMLCSCGDSAQEASKEGPVTTETAKKITLVQDANVELEEIDGELDSLLNALK